MADFDWTHVAIEAGASVSSGFVGLLFGAWKWGRGSARAEQKIKDDYNRKIDDLREQMRTSMGQYEKAATARNDLLVEQFKESFDGIRRQIDENQLSTERRFMPRDDFKDFRDEYREDMKNLNDKLDRLPRTKQ